MDVAESAEITVRLSAMAGSSVKRRPYPARDRAVVPIRSTHRNREVRVVGGAERIRFDASTVAHNEIPRAPPALRS